MLLNRIEITDFRNIERCVIEPSEILNVVIGKNGAGKSSLFEAIHFLGYGRSFRTQKSAHAIRQGASKFSIFAKTQTNSNNTEAQQLSGTVGFSRDSHGVVNCKIDSQVQQSLVSLVSKFPIQLFTPQSTDMFLGSPSERRKFLDWGVFHVEHINRPVFQKYSALLKQRNALLKKKTGLNNEIIKVWDKQFVDYAHTINKSRKVFLLALTQQFNLILAVFLPEFSLEIEYNAGWNENSELVDLLNSKLEKDIQLGVTTIGPHKADLKIKAGGVLVQEYLSRGQLRLVVAALLLARTIALKELKQRQSIFLLDDLGAELDVGKRELFLDTLLASGSQVFVSAINQSQLSFIEKYKNKKMFHVEHGSVSAGE